jgi:Fe-S cluster assembly protein SufD
MSQTEVSGNMKSAGVFPGLFRRFCTETPQPSWLAPFRQRAMTCFEAAGFPTTSDEDWRFTPLSGLARLSFKPSWHLNKTGLTRDDLSRFVFSGIPGARLVFLNGHFAPHLSAPGHLQGGVTITNLAGALRDCGADLEKNFGLLATPELNPFAALNTAFCQDGAVIHVPDGQSIGEPVHLLFISTAEEFGLTMQPRNLVVAGRGSRLTLLESHVSTGTAASFSNTVTEIFAEEDAVVEHCKFQDEHPSAFHMGTLAARLGRGARFASHSVASGARLSRNNIRLDLAGEGVEALLNGLFLTSGDQLADHHMTVNHARPHCESHEYFNGILDGKSKGVFHGRILVQPGAQKTDARQTNKNLLLSDDATVDTRPQLEIYADDVKCTHGATVGQLDEDAIFYLRARGIGTEKARRMLIHAFAGEIIERVRCDAAREELSRRIWDRLEQNPILTEHA